MKRRRLFRGMLLSGIMLLSVNYHPLQAETVGGNTDRYFGIYEIGSDVLNRIQGQSYVENPDISLEDLRYLEILHYDFEHEIQRGDKL